MPANVDVTGDGADRPLSTIGRRRKRQVDDLERTAKAGGCWNAAGQTGLHGGGKRRAVLLDQRPRTARPRVRVGAAAAEKERRQPGMPRFEPLSAT